MEVVWREGTSNCTNGIIYRDVIAVSINNVALLSKMR